MMNFVLQICELFVRLICNYWCKITKNSKILKLKPLIVRDIRNYSRGDKTR